MNEKEKFESVATRPQNMYADNSCAARDDLFEQMLRAQSAGQKKALRRSQSLRKEIEKIRSTSTAQRRQFANQVDFILAAHEADIVPLHRARRDQRKICDDLAQAVRRFGRVGKSIPMPTWELLECTAFFVSKDINSTDKAVAAAAHQVATMKGAIQSAEAFARICETAAKQPPAPPAAEDHLISDLARAWAKIFRKKPSDSRSGKFAGFIETVLGKRLGSDRLRRLIDAAN